jgi:DNA uptake protein ComE-like DNA-binding protein
VTQPGKAPGGKHGTGRPAGPRQSAARGPAPNARRPAPDTLPYAANVLRATPARFRGKAWLLFAVVPFGLTTWAAFLYIGIRARRPRWLAWAAVYAAGLAAFLALDTADGRNGAVAAAAAVIGLLTWFGGGVHATVVSDAAARRISGRPDAALDAARLRMERRAEGRRLAAAQPALAREVGLGRPDIPGGDDYGLVDVNHASPAGLAALPGVTDELVSQIADMRGQVGGFASVDDLGLVLDLPPGVIDQLRDTTIFMPD